MPNKSLTFERRYIGLLYLLRYFLLAILVLLSNPSILFAQVSSGALLQQTESDGADKSISIPSAILAPEKIDSKSQAILVRGFDFQGNELISSNDLRELLLGLVDQKLTAHDIAQIPPLIARYYRTRGYLSRITIASAENGLIVVQVTEVTLSKIIVDNRSLNTYAQDLTVWIYDQLHVGEKLNLNALDGVLLRINSMPSITAKVTQENAEIGGITLRIVLTDKPLLSGVIAVDNYGLSTTGSVRANALLTINVPFGLTDQINVQGIASEGYDFGRVSIASNLANTKLRMGVNSSALKYHTLSGTMPMIQGSAISNSLELYYPVVRSTSANLYLLGSYSQNEFLNQAGAFIYSQYKSSDLSIALGGNALDDLLGGGLTSATISVYSGNINLGGSPSQASDALGPQTAGSFAKARYAIARTQNIFPGLQCLLSLGGQIASKNMDPSEQMYFGGPYAVRAYASGQGAGSQGSIASVELRQDTFIGSQISIFYDYADVQANKFNNYSSATYATAYVLQGAGVALSWNAYGIEAKIVFAVPTGSLGPQGTAAINNSGGLSKSRTWLSASATF